MFVGVWWGSLREGDHFEETGVDGRTILKWMLKEEDGGAWTGLIWIRIERCGGLF